MPRYVAAAVYLSMYVYLCVAPIKIQLISCAALQIVLHKAAAGATLYR